MTILFCQQCGLFQHVGCQLDPCLRCGGAVFHTIHPADQDAAWRPYHTPGEDERDAAILRAMWIKSETRS